MKSIIFTLLIVIIGCSLKVASSEKVWACGIELTRRWRDACKESHYHNSLVALMQRILLKYRRSTKELNHHTKRSARRRIKKRSLSQDCCAKACTYEHIQRNYCHRFRN